MIYGERPQTKLHQDSKGLTGRKTFLCDWADVDPAPVVGLPHYGDSWSPYLPFLRVVNIDADDNGSGLCEYTCQYSTERQLGEEYYETSLEVGTEQIECTKGYTWKNAGTPVTIDIPTLVPVLRYNIRMRRAAPPVNDIVAAINKVNSKVFHGFTAEYMRFDGAETDESVDENGEVIAVQTIYHFTIRDRSHNQEWRPPLQARDAQLNLLWWQDADAGQPFYTTDETKIGTPVFMNQVPGHETAVSGTADWDWPMHGSDYRYALCDFAEVLNLPTKLGDG